MTLAERLQEAEQALHDLQTGKQVVRVQDQNGESVIYTPSNSANLRAYIGSLKARLAAPVHTVRFSTSKGL